MDFIADVLEIIRQDVKLWQLFLALVAILANFFKDAIWNWFTLRRNKRISEFYPKETLKLATRFYIRPECTNVDPNQEVEKAHFSVENSAFRKMDDFIRKDHGGRHLLVLADSGMGKTSLLLNYFAREQARWSGKRIELVPLGQPDVDEYLENLENPGEINLFLDALDEDPLAVVDHKQRVRDLMELCRNFRRVVITCRTQFFPKEEEIPVETGIIKVGPKHVGQGATHVFWKLYLAPLSDKQVDTYIRKRFSIFARSRRKKAREMVERIEDLKARPMILAYIPDLIESNQTVANTADLYRILINNWYQRENEWVNPEALADFSKKLALDIYRNREERKMEAVPGDQVESLAEQWGLTNLEGWQLRGRSLLIRDAVGNFRFAHRSIMEYLFVDAYMELERAERFPLEWTDQMLAFLGLRSWEHIPDSDVTASASGWEVTVRIAGVDFDLVLIPPGTFLMGSPEDEEGRWDNEAQHRVTLTQPFWMGKTTVTQAQWRAVMDDNPSKFKGDDLPVEMVSLQHCREFLDRLNRESGSRGFVLPTEAQWEYACRAGTQTRFSFGNQLTHDQANFGRKLEKTLPAKALHPNAWGLYQMHGNVWEWCEGWYRPYPAGTVTDPGGAGAGAGTDRMVRGGSCNSSAAWCRSAFRIGGQPAYRDDDVGFRLARTLL